jgi:uncharacterized Fe-S cluster-containing radical SAM superfamily protein
LQNGLSKGHALITAEEVGTVVALYERVSGDHYPASDHSRKTVFAASSETNAELYAGLAGESHQMLREKIDEIIDSPKVNETGSTFLHSVRDRINNVLEDQNATSVVISITGAALNEIVAIEGAEMDGRRFLTEALRHFRETAEVHERTVGGFTRFMAGYFNEAELRAVPLSAIDDIRPLPPATS